MANQENTVDLTAFRAKLPQKFSRFLAIMSPLPGSRTLSIDYFGAELAYTRHRDLTGKTTAVLDQHVRELLEYACRASMKTGAHVLEIH